MTHFVEVACNCEHDDPERCVMVRYISDVRIAFDEIEKLSQMLDSVVFPDGLTFASEAA